MSTITGFAMAQIQEIKAQNLATLMSTVDAVGAASRVSSSAEHAANPALAGAIPETIQAVILSAPRDGRVMLSLAGQTVEAQLPHEMQQALAAGTLTLREGGKLPLHFDPATQTLRLGPAPQTTPDAATKVSISGPIDPHATSVGTPPPLANPFPAGSLGAAVARLSGLSFPVSEPVAQTSTPLPSVATDSATILRAQSQPASIAPIDLPDAIRNALIKANAQDSPISQALARFAAMAQQSGGKLADLAQALMGLRLDASQPITPELIAKGLAQSGLLHEANLARGDGAAAAGDLKGLLNAARSQMRDIGARGESPGPNAQDVARAVDGAIERVKLQQIASMPDHPEMRITDDRAQPFRLSLSIPLAPHGQERPETAALGVMIEHRPQTDARFEPDVPTGENDHETFPWKVRIAVDLEETGPVQAEIALRGQSIAVTLWAERHATAGLARREIGTLHQALSKASFDVTRLEVKDGRPSGRAGSSHPVVDRRT